MSSTDYVGAGGAVRLTQWGVLAARGADTTSFLHGQLSNDVAKQSPQQARLAAYCSAQGRMLASFVVVRHAADELWLACPADALPAALKRLSMFVLRAKVALSDASADLHLVGLAGTAARAWLGDAAAGDVWQASPHGDGHVVRLPDGEQQARWVWIGPAEQAAQVVSALPPLPESLWQWLEVRSGVVPVVAATSGQFVPQMLNYELVGGVDFRKGCYPGQEIVARSQYLGKLKRRGFLLDGPEPLAPGQEVFWSGDQQQPAGLIAAAAPHPGGGASALVELKIAAADSGSLHLGASNGPALTLAALPYALPPEAAPTRG